MESHHPQGSAWHENNELVEENDDDRTQKHTNQCDFTWRVSFTDIRGIDSSFRQAATQPALKISHITFSMCFWTAQYRLENKNKKGF